MALKLGADGIECAGKRGESTIELGSHPGTLGALAGEHEGDLSAGTGRTASNASGRLATRERAEPGQQLVALTAKHDRALLELSSPARQRVGDVTQIQFGALGEIRTQPLSLRTQCRLASSRQHPRHHAQPGVALPITTIRD